MNIYDQYTTDRDVREHRIIIVPAAERTKVMDAMHADGWHFTFSGPYTNKKMFPKLDMTRFKFAAERVIGEVSECP